MVDVCMLNEKNEKEKHRFEDMTTFCSWLQEYCTADENEPVLREFYEMVLDRYGAFKISNAYKNQSIWLEFAQKKINDGKFNRDPLVITFNDKTMLERYIQF